MSPRPGQAGRRVPEKEKGMPNMNPVAPVKDSEASSIVTANRWTPIRPGAPSGGLRAGDARPEFRWCRRGENVIMADPTAVGVCGARRCEP